MSTKLRNMLYNIKQASSFTQIEDKVKVWNQGLFKSLTLLLVTATNENKVSRHLCSFVFQGMKTWVHYLQYQAMQASAQKCQQGFTRTKSIDGQEGSIKCLRHSGLSASILKCKMATKHAHKISTRNMGINHCGKEAIQKGVPSDSIILCRWLHSK